MFRNFPGGLFHVGQVRLAPFVERGGDADEDRVHVGQAREIGGGGESGGVVPAANLVGGDVANVGLAGVELFDFRGVGVEAGDAVADFGEAESERQADVAAADDPDAKLLVREMFRCYGGHG